jgi:glycosyltransferase involved in cell wall biosynthesis
MKAVVVIPAHNEEPNLPGVLEQVARAELGFPVVVVDDGSADRTRAIAVEQGARVVSHAVNLGYLRAIQTGMLFMLANGFDYCFTLDADGQHDPAALVALRDRAEMADHPDIVVGSRFLVSTGYRAPLARRAGMSLFSHLTGWVTGQRVYDTTSGLRCWSRPAVSLAVREGLGDLHSEIIIAALLRGLKVAEIPIHVRPRVHGVSMYDAFTSLTYPFKTLLTAVILIRRARRDAAER